MNKLDQLMLDFVDYDEGWAYLFRVLEKAIEGQTSRAARAQRDTHETERGKLIGLETALALIKDAKQSMTRKDI